MAYTTINKGSSYHNTLLYTGDGQSSQAMTGLGFQPDWVWLKARSTTYTHQIFDSIRGTSKLIASSEATAQQTTSGVTAFGTDGFTVGSDAGSNNNTTTFTSWNWLAGGSSSSNSNGSLTSTVSANTTAGFSIVKYTGNGTSGATVGHGLSSKPDMIILKSYENGQQWAVYHSALGAEKGLRFNATNAVYDSTARWNDTEPTSTLFTIGSDGEVNTNTEDHIAYCFHSVKGYSKFGSYIGNGSNSGAMIYTGFKPSWVLIKRTDSADGWLIIDNKRVGRNGGNNVIEGNVDTAEDSGVADRIDILSNGFKLKNSWTKINASGGDYVYMAFAEHPFLSSTGTPVTAR